MIPNDYFRYLKNNLIAPDTSSLLQLYQPIMGSDAYVVYSYLVHFFDNGRAAHRFSDLLNHVQLGFDRLLLAFDVLGALGLINLYQDKETYLIKLQSPLDREAFLANPVYYNLLKSYIGQVALEELTLNLPQGLVDLTKPFSAVFTDRGEVYHRPRTAKVDFELAYFKEQMARDGLTFTDETSDVLALYHLSEERGLTWFELYQLAKATVVDKKISLNRLKTQQGLLSQVISPQSSGNTQEGQTSLKPNELALIKTAKRHSAEDFLKIWKQEKRAVVIKEERDLLKELGQQGFLDPVINIMVFRTLQRTQSANLNRVFLMKLANDLNSRGIKTPEEALAHLTRPLGRPNRPAPDKASTTNVPAWSDQDYKNDTSQEEQARLEAYKQQRLAELERED